MNISSLRLTLCARVCGSDVQLVGVYGFPVQAGHSVDRSSGGVHPEGPWRRGVLEGVAEGGVVARVSVLGSDSKDLGADWNVFRHGGGVDGLHEGWGVVVPVADTHPELAPGRTASTQALQRFLALVSKGWGHTKTLGEDGNSFPLLFSWNPASLQKIHLDISVFIFLCA